MKLIKQSLICMILLFKFLCFLPAVNRLAADNEKLYFNEVYILESERVEGKYLTGNLDASGFQKYHWTQLSSDNKYANKMITIRGTFFIDESLKKTNLAIYLGPSEYPYRVYINNHMVARRGKDILNMYESILNSSYAFLSGSFLNYGTAVNTLALEAYPYGERTSISDIYIAADEVIKADVFLRNLVNINSAQAIFVLTFLLGIYFLMVFFFQGVEQRKYLFFAFTCFFFGVNTVNMAFYYEWANGLLLFKLSRIGLSLCSGAVCLFVFEFAQILNHKKRIKFIIIIPAVVLAVLTALMPGKTALINFFNTIVSNFYITPLLAVNIVLLLIALIKKKNIYALPILLGFVGVIVTSVHDLIYLKSFAIPYFWTLPFGFTALVISIFFVLSREQALVYKASLEHQKKIDIKNLALSSIIEKIKLVSGNLNRSYNQLNDIVSQSINVIKNYERSNNILVQNSMHHLDDLDHIVNHIQNSVEESNIRLPKMISSQMDIIRQITSTVASMNAHIENTMESSRDSNSTAKNLAELASKSSDIISESKTFLIRLAEYSSFINDVLNSIEDITERTKILSINAAIEAARAGTTGKGFSVVAVEIRKMASQSKGNLNSSFNKIKEMDDTIKKSDSLAEEVGASLYNIITQSQNSAEKIEHITQLIQEQKARSLRIMQDVKSFLENSNSLKVSSEKEIVENENIKKSLRNLKNTFVSMTEQLKEQLSKGEDLQQFLEKVNIVMKENVENVTILNQCVEDAIN